MKNYNVNQVIRSLSKKNDLKIEGNIIYILKDFIYNPKTFKKKPNPLKKHDLGNGSWGKIDFLTKYHGFRINYVNKYE